MLELLDNPMFLLPALLILVALMLLVRRMMKGKKITETEKKQFQRSFVIVLLLGAVLFAFFMFFKN